MYKKNHLIMFLGFLVISVFLMLFKKNEIIIQDIKYL